MNVSLGLRKLSVALLCSAMVTTFAQSPTQSPRQGDADLGLGAGGVRLGPGMSSASVGDASYHNGAIPRRKRILAWGDVSQGYQHDSVSHALATIERLGYETGAYGPLIGTDWQRISNHWVVRFYG